MGRGKNIFLGAACLGMLAWEPKIFAASPPTVVVLGAGLSGLTAAHRLQQFGVNVEVYEANNRPGGRVYTFYFEDGSYEELGGSNFADAQDQSEILQLVKEMGLELEQKPSFGMQKAFCQFPQMPLRPMRSIFSTLPEPKDEALHRAMQWMEEAGSLSELLQKMFFETPELQTFFHYFYSCYEGSSPECLTPHYLQISLWDFYTRFWGMSQEVYVSPVQFKTGILGGNSLLIHALAHSLTIHYGSVLKKIERGDQKKFRLTFADGSSLETDYLILTLPCTTLREVQIQEGLIPQDQWQAIQTLQYATHAKVILPVVSDRSDITLFNERFCTWTNQTGLLTCYQYGEAGLFDGTSLDAVQKMIEENWKSISNAYPDLQRAGAKEALLVRGQSQGPLAPLAISWAQQPFAKGSYSNFGVEQSPSFAERKRLYKILGEEVLYLFRPIEDRVFFAGEHTALIDFATLGGAVQSGEKAARMIYRALESKYEKEENFFLEYLEVK